MRFIYDKEIRLAAIIMAGVSALAFLASCYISLLASIVNLCLSLSLLCIFFIFTKRRHTRISSICEQIDISLHSDKAFDIAADENDELAALLNQIRKMSVKLREQDLYLHKDKKYLKDYIANISRQLRIPLTSINIVSSFLAAGNLSSERQDELIRELSTLLTTTNQLIASLLKIIRIDAGTASFRQISIDVETILDKAIKSHSILLKQKNISINIEHETEKASFQGDPAWSAEAFGHIIKSILESADVSHINISFAQNITSTEIHIKHDGKGHAKAILSEFFERSYRHKSVAELNLSAGLTLGRMIIARQNGTITVENLKSGGACLSIKFYHPIQPAQETLLLPSGS